MTGHSKSPRGAIKHKRAAVATTLGRRLVEGLARGEIIDRSQVQPQSGTKKRIATPAGLARFFRPIGEA